MKIRTLRGLYLALVVVVVAAGLLAWLAKTRRTSHSPVIDQEFFASPGPGGYLPKGHRLLNSRFVEAMTSLCEPSLAHGPAKTKLPTFRVVVLREGGEVLCTRLNAERLVFKESRPSSTDGPISALLTTKTARYKQLARALDEAKFWKSDFLSGGFGGGGLLIVEGRRNDDYHVATGQWNNIPSPLKETISSLFVSCQRDPELVRIDSAVLNRSQD